MSRRGYTRRILIVLAAAGTGCFNKTASGVTQTWSNSSGAAVADGTARVTGKKHSCWGLGNGCNFVFTVTSVTKPGMIYDASANVMTANYIPCS